MAFFKGRARAIVFGLLSLAALVAVIGRSADGQTINPFAYPKPLPGTPPGYVPIATDAGAAIWGPISVDAGSISPGTAGQGLYTNAGATSPFWKTPPLDNVALHSGIDCTGAADSSSALTTLVAANAPTGVATYIPNGCTLKVASPVTLVSNALVVGSPGAVVNSTIVGTGFTNSTFFVQGTNYGTTASTTLSANATKGSRTVSVASVTGFVAGQSVMLGSVSNGNTAQQFTVASVGGSTLTFDDPIEFTFVTNDTVRTFTAPTAIQVLGQGMTMQGSGGALLEFAACQRCVIADINVPTTTVSSYIGSLDVGGRDNVWLRLHVNGNATTPKGLSLESNVRSKAIDCTAENFTNAGYWESTGARNEFRGDKAWNCAYGLLTGASASTDPDGAARGKVVGCDFNGNSAEGIYLGGVTDYDIAETHADHNTTAGIAFELSGFGTANTEIRLSSVTASNEPYGLFIDTGSHTLTSSGLVTDLDTSAAINIGDTSTVDLVNWWATDDVLGGGSVVTTGGASTFEAKTAHVRKTQNNASNWIAFNVNASASYWSLDDVSIERVGTPTGTTYGVFVGAAGTVKLHDVRTVGTITNGIVSAGVASNLLLGLGVDFSSATTPVNIDSTAQFITTTIYGNATGGALATFSQANGVGFSESTYPTSGNTLTSGLLIDPWAHVYSTDFDTGNSPTAMTIGAAKAVSITQGNATTTTQQTFKVVSGDDFSFIAGATTMLDINGSNGIAVGGTVYPGSFGGDGLGVASFPFGASYLGASTTSGTGYTQFAAHGGTKDTQDAIDQWSCFDVNTINSSFGPVNAQTYLIPAHHGMRVECHATGRIVTAGVGGSFWTATADHTYSCTQAASEGWTGSTSLGNNAWYGQCDCSGGICTSLSAPTNPLITFAANVTGSGTGTLQVAYTLFNDGSTTKPVVDILSCCRVEDN